jgi:hypothetical protein
MQPSEKVAPGISEYKTLPNAWVLQRIITANAANLVSTVIKNPMDE